jgi:excisionase family DNA binding protein
MTTLLTVEQAAEQLGGVSRSTLYQLMRSGELASVKIGRRRLIPAEAIADYVLDLRVGSTSR